MSPANRKISLINMRQHPRFHSVREIAVNYEGQREEISLRLPDISARGMFINTRRTFPDGAVLNLRFRLAISGVQIHTRCEVRYCLPGVGVGVEFIGMSRKALLAIEHELKLGRPRSSRAAAVSKK